MKFWLGTTMILARLAAPGPHAVTTYDVVWHDAARNRDVAARIYAPADGNALPVIVFSHGLGNSREGYSYLGRHWASQGFVSVHPEHLGADIEVTHHGLWHLYRAGFDRTLWRSVPDDDRFVIDQLQRDDALPQPLRGRLDTTRIGVAGHSLGAYAALAIGGMHVPIDGASATFRDPRVRAAIPISMSENIPCPAYDSVAVPMLHITGTHDSSLLYGTTPGKRRLPFDCIARQDQTLLTIAGANHSTPSDEESPENRKAHDVIRAATTLFWDVYLRDDDAARGPLREANAFAPVARVEVRTPNDTLHVGRIKVNAVPLFNETEASQGGFYRTANMLAVRTRAKLIRRFLTFHEGEVFDEARLRESERNLRTLDFLKTASVKAGPPHDGLVDVNVETQDAWTTDFNVDFTNDGGEELYDVAVTQKDLFGSGAEADLRIGTDRERTTRSIEVIHPALVGRPYWAGNFLFANSSDGNEERLTFERPLFSYVQRYTASLSLDNLSRNSRIYADGDVASLFRQHHRRAILQYGPIIAATHNSTTRVLGGVDVINDRFKPLVGLAPDDRRFHFLEVGIDHTAINYITLDHVDLGIRSQDYNLGTQASFFAGASSGVYRFRAEASVGRRLAPRAFVMTRLSATTRSGRTNRNAIFDSDSRLVIRFGQTYPETFVARLRVDSASDADRDVQFFADGLYGLRAYPNFAFVGTRRLVFNAEHRVYLGREWLQVFEPGFAVFADSGEAMNGTPFSFRNLHTDVGAGLRFSVARFESAIIRIDVAYAFNDSPVSRRGVVFSFATTQAF